MGNREIKQQARRAALDAQTKRREARAERERRLERLAIQVLVAIREREAAMLGADRRAGQALTEMIETERLTAREAVQWCSEEVSMREVARLRRVAAEANEAAREEASGADTDTRTTAPAARGADGATTRRANVGSVMIRTPTCPKRFVASPKAGPPTVSVAGFSVVEGGGAATVDGDD